MLVLARSRPTARASTASSSRAARCATRGEAPGRRRHPRRAERRPTDDPQWLVPGIFYGENRPADCTCVYPRFTPGHVDVARMESDSWSFRADRCATPAVFARGGGLITSERSPLGQSGVGFAYRDGRPQIWLDFPYREEPLRYDGSDTPQPPDVQTHRWQPGESVELEFRQSDGDWRREVTRPRDSPSDKAWVSVAEAAELAAWGLYRWHFRDDPPRLVETVGFDGELERDAMHVSWISGVPYAYALLRHGRRVGNDDYVRAAEAVLDHVAVEPRAGRHVLAAVDARSRLDVGLAPRPPRAHARTLADATLFMLRAGGRWEAAARSNVDVALRTQREDGALPSAHSLETGDALSWEGTAGMSWIPRARRSRPPRRGAARGRVLRAVRHVVRRARGRRPRAELRGRLRGRHGVRRARGLGERAPCRRLDAHLPLHVRRALRAGHRPRPLRLQDTRRRQRVAAEPAPARVRPDLPPRADAARRAVPRERAREPRLLPPVHRARGRRLRRAQGNGRRALPADRLLRREGDAAAAVARVVRSACCCTRARRCSRRELPGRIPLGRRDVGVPDRGLARRRRARPVDLGRLRRRERRPRHASVRPLPPLARGRRPDRRARRQRVPLLARVAAALPERARQRRAARLRPLRPADRRAAGERTSSRSSRSTTGTCRRRCRTRAAGATAPPSTRSPSTRARASTRTATASRAGARSTSRGCTASSATPTGSTRRARRTCAARSRRSTTCCSRTAAPPRRSATARSASRSASFRRTRRATTDADREAARDLRRLPQPLVPRRGARGRRIPTTCDALFEERVGPLDFVRDGDLDGSRRSDFVGVNYYSRGVIRAKPGKEPLPYEVLSARQMDYPLTGGGYEIAPWALTELLVRLRDDYGETPIYITENGAIYPEAPHDPERVEFIRDHVARDRRRDRARRRRARLLPLVAHGQLRVGDGLRAALRARARRLRDVRANDQGQRPRLRRDRAEQRPVSVDFAAAEQFMLREARLLERRRFAWRFGGGSADAVVAALLAYRTTTAASATRSSPTCAGRRASRCRWSARSRSSTRSTASTRTSSRRACDWLVVRDERRRRRSVRARVGRGRAACGVVGAERRGGREPDRRDRRPAAQARRRPRVARAATGFCFDALADLDHVGPDDAISVLTSSSTSPIARVRTRSSPGWASGSWTSSSRSTRRRRDTSRRRSSSRRARIALARRLFDDATIERHLDALEAKQQDDGGWPITWEPPSVAAVHEWRGVVTFRNLASSRATGGSREARGRRRRLDVHARGDRRDRAAASPDDGRRPLPARHERAAARHRLGARAADARPRRAPDAPARRRRASTKPPRARTPC